MLELHQPRMAASETLVDQLYAQEKENGRVWKTYEGDKGQAFRDKGQRAKCCILVSLFSSFLVESSREPRTMSRVPCLMLQCTM